MSISSSRTTSVWAKRSRRGWSSRSCLSAIAPGPCSSFALQVKWQTEMQEKFGLEFRIVDTEYVKHLRRERGIHVNPWTSYPRLVALMDWMKS